MKWYLQNRLYIFDRIELVVVQEESSEWVEGVEREAWWEGCKFVIGKIDFDEVDVALDKIELLDAGLALWKDQHFHIFWLFDLL